MHYLYSSPVVIAWDHVLSGNMSNEDTYAITEMFKDTDYLSTRQFTVIHKIVLGLVTKDLEIELQCSTSDINTVDTRGRSPLSWASARGDAQSVQTLLQHGANANLADNEGNSPLHYAKTATCAQLLLDRKADVSSRNRQGATPLYSLCHGSGDVPLLALLLSAGADPHTPNHEQQTPLHCAAFNSHTACVEHLLAHGVDINVRNASGDSPLRFALMFHAHDALRLMLQGPPAAGTPQTANFSGINSYGHTFAHSIARAADLQTVRILLEERTDDLALDVEVMDMNGKTCVDYFEERLLLLREGTGGAELEAAFAQLVRKVTGSRDGAREVGGDDVVVGELEAEVEDKLAITIEAVELVVVEEAEERGVGLVESV